MRSLLFILVFIFPFVSSSHPGIGIVKDSKGNIYYTDLEHVWKISKAGKKSIVIRNVHTHELYIDASDNLFGEHLWYNGERSDTWGHYVWKYNSKGKLDTIKGPEAGFLEDYSFVRDRQGNMYSVQRFKKTTIRKISPNGSSTIIAEGNFKNIRWMHALEDGTLFFVDYTDLYTIRNNKLSLVAKNLGSRTSVMQYAGMQHNVYGIWTDKKRAVYLAVLGGQVVKKIEANGKIKDIIYSEGTWKPASGLFDDDGNLWLMEVNSMNRVRLRSFSQKELAIAANPSVNFLNKAKPLIMAGLIITALLLIVQRLAGKLKSWNYSEADRRVKFFVNPSE